LNEKALPYSGGLFLFDISINITYVSQLRNCFFASIKQRKLRVKIVKKCLLAILLVVSIFEHKPCAAQTLSEKLSEIDIRPFGRMIRQCCNFGYGAPVYWVPVNMGYITSSDHLGKHVFYGDEQEGNGIIYSNHGGFLDLGHIRDNADLVAYFSWHLSNNLGKDTIIETVREGGKRKIHLQLTGHDLTEDDLLRLAQRISYEMAVWHEIRTHFGVPTYWPVHEKQSSFSPEDNYSNLLGTYVGYRALKADGSYLNNVEREINELLNSYEAVSTSEETRQAMDDVRGLWWRKVSLPSNRFLLAKYFDSYGSLKPWMVPNHLKMFESQPDPVTLSVPETTLTGIPLTDLFTIEIKPAHRIPVRKVLNRKRGGGITEIDFPEYVNWIRRSETERLKRKNRKLRQKPVQQPVTQSR
jgi:hypothetical protein